MNISELESLSPVPDGFLCLMTRNWGINEPTLLEKSVPVGSGIDTRTSGLEGSDESILMWESAFWSNFEACFERCRQFSFTTLRGRWCNKCSDFNSHYRSKRGAPKKTRRVMAEIGLSHQRRNG